ncbi:hypothetical protein EDB83DRAFT_2309451 [Lactarius deliciosus]|nr:hypothetical protein EDB83DRAFT_2309451 [Lactarius deliciosus]
MPGFKLAFTLAAATYAFGKYILSEDDTLPPPPPPPPPPAPTDHGRGVHRTSVPSTGAPSQSQLSSSAHNQNTTQTSAPNDYDRGVSHSSRTPSQTQLPLVAAAVAVFAISRYFFGGNDDGPTPRVEDLESAEKLREKARRSGREMTEAYNRAKSAQRIGDRLTAQEHRQRGDAHKSLMEELDEQAAKIIFRENNKDRDDGMVDLHGLYVAEAVRFANEQLRSTRSKRNDVVYFIVGKGLHSDAGARIRPALEDLCTKQGLDHSLDPNNAGVLVVRLD